MNLKHFALALLCVFLVACGSTTKQIETQSTGIPKDSRIDYAQMLYAQEKYAESLQQWRILRLAFPDNKFVHDSAQKSQAKIDTKKRALLAELKRNGLSQTRKKAIKIELLSLTPDDAQIKEFLRAYDYQASLQNAQKKTNKQTQLLKTNNTQAQTEIKLKEAIEHADKLYRDAEYLKLLEHLSHLQSIDADNSLISKYSLSSYSHLADMAMQDQNALKALEYLQKAQTFAKGAESERLVKLQKEIRQTQADMNLKSAQQVFNLDIEKAIEHLRLALQFLPENRIIKQRLNQALKIQRNLQGIINQK